MAKCRQCGAKVSDTEVVCPVCGLINPIKQKSKKTVEITSTLSLEDVDAKDFKPKYKRIVSLLFTICGWSGAGFFYLGFKKQGLFWLLFNFILIGGLSGLGVTMRVIDFIPGLLIVTGGFYLVNIVFGLTYLFAHDRKDGKGQFLE